MCEIMKSKLACIEVILELANTGQGKPHEGQALLSIKPNLLRTHPGDIDSLEAYTPGDVEHLAYAYSNQWGSSQRHYIKRRCTSRS
jgi:hypothetical protein